MKIKQNKNLSVQCIMGYIGLGCNERSVVTTIASAFCIRRGHLDTRHTFEKRYKMPNSLFRARWRLIPQQP